AARGAERRGRRAAGGRPDRVLASRHRGRVGSGYRGRARARRSGRQVAAAPFAPVRAQTSLRVPRHAMTCSAPSSIVVAPPAMGWDTDRVPEDPQTRALLDELRIDRGPYRPRRRRGLFTLIAVLLLAAGGGAWWYTVAQPRRPAVQTAVARAAADVPGTP